MLNYPNETIGLGYNNPSLIFKIKSRLNELGYGPLTPTIPNFGTTTIEVVKKFQKDNNLIQDGIIGELTWHKLFPVITSISLSPLSNTVISIAMTQVLVRELTNKNDGIDVEKYLKAVGLGKGYAWCMAFVYWCFLEASKKLNINCPVPKTAGVLDCYNKALKYRVIKPEIGSQFIMDFGKGQGHTGIVTKVVGNRIFTIEGNTSADPSYAGEDREGNGVFERNRAISSIKGFIFYK
jgi:peptidoglycan hydrolase-like protein with peptidoglycan-binding domain